MTTNAMAFGPDLLVSAKFSASRPKKIATAWHSWTLLQEQAPPCSIPHQTHMEDIQGSGCS
ncbi:MAG: hypothetical protein ACK53Y_15875 [bacterium]